MTVQTPVTFLQRIGVCNSEQEQALMRFIFSLLVSAYLFFSFLFDPATPVRHNTLFISFGYLAFSALLAAVILRDKTIPKYRPLLSMAGDMTALTMVISMTQETGALFYGLYLWIIVGNGLRYGSQALIISHILGVAGFLFVILTNSYWLAHSTLAIGLLLTLILIPVFTFKLLKRLSNAATLAEEASQAKSRFLANMSHEMRTPLNGVIGTTDLILETPLNEEQKDLVRTMRNSGQLLLKLIENVLDLSKIESGKVVAEIVSFDLHSLSNGVMDMFMTQAEKKGIRLHTHFSPETCFLLRGDSLHLRQVIINLVGNAVKFTDQGTVELRVTTVSQDETSAWLRFEIADTGIGIASASQQAIFESFTQASTSIATQYGGTGLGTTIAKQLVEFMGGQIGLQSEEGKGSIFWFELPLEKQSERRTGEAARLGFMRVMGVGLGATDHEILEGHLSGWGMQIENSSSLARFFSRLIQINSSRQHGIVVLVALQNLKMDARKFADHIWAEFSPQKVSLILIDPDLQKNTEKELLGMGYSCLLKTPVDKTLLFNALHGVMATPQISGAISFKDYYERANQGKRELSILVADDNGTNRKIISKILEHGGHRVELAENGEEALNLLENRKFDLAILDMYMPVMGGLEAARIYRVASGKSAIPIAILTANATTEAKHECEEAEIDAFLTKPVDAATLLNTVARLTARRKGAQSAVERASASFPPVPAFQDTVALVNDGTLRRLLLLGEGGEFVESVIQGFISESELLLDSMKTALLRFEYSTFKDLVHTLKGGAGNVGAEALFHLCREILQLNHTDLQAAAQDSLSRMEECFRGTKVELSRYLMSASEDAAARR
ncbi:MAG: ATP-binding protein [Gallionellaceae bacterium]|nr:ATP-binding protein [Gallionellaceae bacterium]